jgi:hypothetical protein
MAVTIMDAHGFVAGMLGLIGGLNVVVTLFWDPWMDRTAGGK